MLKRPGLPAVFELFGRASESPQPESTHFPGNREALTILTVDAVY